MTSITKTNSINDLLNHLNFILNEKKYIDSVHKIKIITTHEMILKIISE
jgi:hypothetical protein